MTLSSRLALAMVLLAVVAACVVGAFTYYFLTAVAVPQGVAVTIGQAVLAGGAVAVLLALALAASFAQSLSGQLLRMTDAAEALVRGELTPIPVRGVSEITVLATAFERDRGCSNIRCRASATPWW
jgi:methyl-accepting chemotaxis protein